MNRRYRTIVADPPWRMTRAHSVSWRPGTRTALGSSRLSYPTMNVEAITALPVASLAEANAHLYLWTTQRFLWDARNIAKGWGFAPVSVLTWCKPPTGFSLGGTFGQASEFCIFARRGSLKAISRTNRDWWEWSRGEHSAKPEAFMDLVESVSPGPYLELFARRQRLGWDTWGDEALQHVEMKNAAEAISEPSRVIELALRDLLDAADNVACWPEGAVGFEALDAASKRARDVLRS